MGWAYTIWQQGKLKKTGQGGYKVTPGDMADGQGLAFSIDTRIHVASFSKTITAVAVARLIELGKLQWDDPVSKYLPANWKLHPGFEKLTTAGLMAMKSGINEPLDAESSYYSNLQTIMEKGPDPQLVDRFNYQNASYGLFRIIIAYAQGYRPYGAGISSTISAMRIAAQYKKFVTTYILEPAGIRGADCSITDEIPAFQYPFPYNGEAGEITGAAGRYENGDLSAYAGAFGWYLSAREAGAFANALL